MTPDSPGPILMVHNHYQQRGGEDRVFEDEVALLRDHGHEVHTYTLHNDALKTTSPLAAALDTLWNRKVAQELAGLVRAKGIRIAHFHNTFPQVSPAAYGAVRRAGAATVQTLHNYRLLCAGALLYRDGAVCEDCLGRALPWPALRHRCYRQSLPATGTVVAMQLLHRALGTWGREVDAFIALTEGAKSRFASANLPAEKIHVLGNFLPEGPEPSPVPAEGHALFLGRLDESKGVRTLLQAYALHSSGLPRLVIAGDGTMAPEVQHAAAIDPRITWAGMCNAAQVQDLLRTSVLVLVPSEWPEMFGMVVLEAWRAGRPVLGSKIGALAELVHPNTNGWQVPPGDAIAWAEALSAYKRRHSNEYNVLGAKARAGFTQNHASSRHYQGLLAIYQNARKLGSQARR